MNNSLLLPEARGPGSCFQGFCSPLSSCHREQAAVEHSCLHDGVCMAVRCLLGRDALTGLGRIRLRAPPNLLHPGLQQRGQVRARASSHRSRVEPAIPWGGFGGTQTSQLCPPCSWDRCASSSWDKAGIPRGCLHSHGGTRNSQNHVPLWDRLVLSLLPLPHSHIFSGFRA